MDDLFTPTRTAEVLALAVRVRAGDGRALTTLAAPVRVRLAGFLRGVGPTLADDCWSAALVRIWQACCDCGPRALEAQPSPQGWLVKCAHNAARDVARRMHRHSAREIPCDVPIETALSSAVDGEEQREHTRNLVRLEAAIETLTPLDRSLFHYRYTLGCSQETTAARMGLSQPTVSRLERAMLIRLRTMIG